MAEHGCRVRRRPGMGLETGESLEGRDLLGRPSLRRFKSVRKPLAVGYRRVVWLPR